MPVPPRGPTIAQLVSTHISGIHASELTVRRDPRDRSPICESEIFRTSVPRNDEACHDVVDLVCFGQRNCGGKAVVRVWLNSQEVSFEYEEKDDFK